MQIGDISLEKCAHQESVTTGGASHIVTRTKHTRLFYSCIREYISREMTCTVSFSEMDEGELKIEKRG